VFYLLRVHYDDFQEAVLAIAGDGARITKGTVALRLEIPPATASVMLDRMVKDGRLELDIDERSGEIFYQVAKPREAAGKSALAEIAKARGGGSLASRLAVSSVLAAATASAEGGALPPERRRKIMVGVIVGGLLPGFGLAYAAPWPIVVAASVIFFAGFKLVSLIPLLSAFLLIPFVAVCAVASAILGGLYTWQYNQHGKRTPLGDEPTSPRELFKRLRM
jgi:hypothetical protein